MARGPLFQAGYRPLFSGHQTFPLRYGWLKKAYDAVVESGGDKGVFLDDGAIAYFGVGKNMVGSIRHWAAACGVIEEAEGSPRLSATPLGHLLFGEDGVDRYLEHPASLWLLHWKLCAGESTQGLKTTWFWSLNHFTGAIFRREDLVDGLMKLAENRGWPRVSRTTVQRDVECFVRTYESRPVGHRGEAEDSLESALAELGLIRGMHGQFHFVRGPKRSLSDEVFVVALSSFWNRQGAAGALSYEAIAHEPGSPGRVFLLDEADLSNRLLALDEVSGGALQWSETAGLKQVLRRRSLAAEDVLELLRSSYVSPARAGVGK